MKKIGALILGSMLLTGCIHFEQETPSQPTAAGCDTTRAKTLEGKVLPPAARIKETSGATHVRVLKKNQAATMDYRSDRITLLVDDLSGKVLKASCG